jgi:hypothetical protein
MRIAETTFAGEVLLIDLLDDDSECVLELLLAEEAPILLIDNLEGTVPRSAKVSPNRPPTTAPTRVTDAPELALELLLEDVDGLESLKLAPLIVPASIVNNNRYK